MTLWTRMPTVQMRLVERGHPQAVDHTIDYSQAMQHEVLRPSGQGMFCFQPEDLKLAAVEPYLLTRLDRGNACWVAGAYVHHLSVGVATIKGVLVHPAFRGQGMASTLLKEVVAAERRKHPGITLEADVRVYADGAANAGSAGALAAAGFRAVDIRRHRLTGDLRDRHLAHTAEADGSVRALLMRLPPPAHRPENDAVQSQRSAR